MEMFGKGFAIEKMDRREATMTRTMLLAAVTGTIILLTAMTFAGAVSLAIDF